MDTSNEHKTTENNKLTDLKHVFLSYRDDTSKPRHLDIEDLTTAVVKTHAAKNIVISYEESALDNHMDQRIAFSFEGDEHCDSLGSIYIIEKTIMITSDFMDTWRNYICEDLEEIIELTKKTQETISKDINKIYLRNYIIKSLSLIITCNFLNSITMKVSRVESKHGRGTDSNYTAIRLKSSAGKNRKIDWKLTNTELKQGDLVVVHSLST